MKQREDYNRQLFRIIHDEIKTINFTSLPNETVDRGKQKKQLKTENVWRSDTGMSGTQKLRHRWLAS